MSGKKDSKKVVFKEQGVNGRKWSKTCFSRKGKEMRLVRDHLAPSTFLVVGDRRVKKG